MTERQYTIILDPDEEEGGYTVPALPGCITQGETLEEAAVTQDDARSIRLSTSKRTPALCRSLVADTSTYTRASGSTPPMATSLNLRGPSSRPHAQRSHCLVSLDVCERSQTAAHAGCRHTGWGI